MKEVERFEVDALIGDRRIVFEDHRQAEIYARTKLYEAWIKQQNAKPYVTDQTLICENYYSFKEALSDGNVLQIVENKPCYITSDGKEFWEKTPANMHEFELGLKALMKTTDTSNIDIVSLVARVKTEMLNEE